jgi:hypothetical protein
MEMYNKTLTYGEEDVLMDMYNKTLTYGEEDLLANCCRIRQSPILPSKPQKCRDWCI